MGIGVPSCLGNARSQVVDDDDVETDDEEVAVVVAETEDAVAEFALVVDSGGRNRASSQGRGFSRYSAFSFSMAWTNSELVGRSSDAWATVRA